jgi:LuxR family maltose regulon positive regulatory protein
VEAVVHAIEGHGWDLLVELLDAGWNEIVTSRRVAEHLRAVPDAEAAARPDLAALRSALLHAHLRQYAAVPAIPGGSRAAAESAGEPVLRSVLAEQASPSIFLRINGHGAASVSLVREMEDAYAHASRDERAEVAQFLPSVGLQWALCWLLNDDLDRAASAFSTTYELAVTHEVPFSVRNCAGGLGLLFTLAGDPVRAQRWLDQEGAAPVDESPFATMTATVGQAARALLAIDRLDLAGAERELAQAPDPSERNEMWPFVAYAHAELALLRGEPHRGLQLLSAARVAHAAQASGRAAQALLGAAGTNLLLGLGQGSEAAALLSRLPAGHPVLRAPRARVALLGGDPAGALRELTAGRLEDHAHGRSAVEATLLAALAHLRLDRVPEAAAELARSVAAVGETGVVRPFRLLAREDLAALVGAAPAGQHLLVDPRLPERPVFPAAASLVSLTGRERLVLEHLDTGLVPAQIAAQLVLSPNTIKSQVRSIYKKLGASSRDEALTIAHRSGILSDRT